MDSALKRQCQSSLSFFHILSGKGKNKYFLDIVVFNNRGKRYFKSLRVVFLATLFPRQQLKDNVEQTIFFVVVVETQQ